MSKFDDALVTFTEDMRSMNLPINEDSYHAMMLHLGPSIYDRDASLVACTDPKERERIKHSFLVGKLGLNNDDPALDDAIDEVCKIMGQSNRHKYRPTFYYLLMTTLKQDFSKLG